MKDIAFPNNNEEEFEIKAKEMDKVLIFIYPFKKDFVSKHNYGFLSDKKIKPFSVYKANGNNRKAFENGVDLIYYLEFGKEKDFIFARNSGMNHVLAKIAKENNVTIGFSYHDFLKTKNKAVILGRMQQNYMLCK